MSNIAFAPSDLLDVDQAEIYVSRQFISFDRKWKSRVCTYHLAYRWLIVLTRSLCDMQVYILLCKKYRFHAAVEKGLNYTVTCTCSCIVDCTRFVSQFVTPYVLDIFNMRWTGAFELRLQIMFINEWIDTDVIQATHK